MCGCVWVCVCVGGVGVGGGVWGCVWVCVCVCFVNYNHFYRNVVYLFQFEKRTKIEIQNVLFVSSKFEHYNQKI